MRVEWVDDTSANIVFEDSAIAYTALENFSACPTDSNSPSLPPVQLREAKLLPTHPESKLLVRSALVTDQKRPRAYEASRFYMMHPEHDPREQRRRGERRESHSSRAYRSRNYSEEEHRRRRQKDHQDGFDPSMYDDHDTSTMEDSVDCFDDEHSYSGRLRSDRPTRTRSASPRNGRNGDINHRRRTPPPSYRAQDPHPFPSGNRGKELFPTKSSARILNHGKDLSSNKLLAVGLKKELFPDKAHSPNHHRRSDAFDAADETASLFASGLSVSSLIQPQEIPESVDRLISFPASDKRLKGPDAAPKMDRRRSKDSGISILGASDPQDAGFLIRGGANAKGTIKELFPGKALGNEGKELFAGQLHGRSVRRNRAADMFQD